MQSKERLAGRTATSTPCSHPGDPRDRARPLSGELASAEARTDPIFGLEVPVEVPGVDSALLSPRETWDGPEAYDAKAKELAAQTAEQAAAMRAS